MRVGEDRAKHLIHVAGSGTTFALIAVAPADRDMEPSTSARESIIATVTTEKPATPPAAGGRQRHRTAVGPAGGTAALSARERDLPAEWLVRIAAR